MSVASEQGRWGGLSNSPRTRVAMAAAASTTTTTTKPIQYGQYTVPHHSEMVNFSVGQVRMVPTHRQTQS